MILAGNGDQAVSGMTVQAFPCSATYIFTKSFVWLCASYRNAWTLSAGCPVPLTSGCTVGTEANRLNEQVLAETPIPSPGRVHQTKHTGLLFYRFIVDNYFKQPASL